MIVYLPNPVPWTWCSLSSTPVNHSVPCSFLVTLFPFCFQEDLGLGFSTFAPITSTLFHSSHTPFTPIPWTCKLFPICAFSRVLYFSWLQGSSLHLTGGNILWEASIHIPFPSRLTYVWTQTPNLRNMEQGWWTGLCSHENAGHHETNDLISFMICPPHSVLERMFFEGKIICPSHVHIPVPSALPSIE